LSLRLYMDHHVQFAITEGLRNRGIDVLTTQQDNTARLDDESLLARATVLDRVLVSEDRDLIIIANRWLQSGREFSGLIYAHQLIVTIGRAVHDLELMAKILEPEDMLNHIQYLPL
jgi:hypothetical protein